MTIEYQIVPHIPGDNAERILLTIRMRKKIAEYKSWIIENGIEAFIPGSFIINFQHEEDIVAFKLKFGV